MGSSASTRSAAPENKRTILAAEGADPDGLEALARSGIRYVGSDTTRIFCMPTCHDARRATERHTRPVPLGAGGGRRGLPALPPLPAGRRRGAA